METKFHVSSWWQWPLRRPLAVVGLVQPAEKAPIANLINTLRITGASMNLDLLCNWPRSSGPDQLLPAGKLDAFVDKRE